MLKSAGIITTVKDADCGCSGFVRLRPWPGRPGCRSRTWARARTAIDAMSRKGNAVVHAKLPPVRCHLRSHEAQPYEYSMQNVPSCSGASTGSRPVGR